MIPPLRGKVFFMKHKLGIILLLTFILVVAAPPSMAASAPLEYEGEMKDEGFTFDVDANFRLDVTCSDNWRYWPGLTSDTLTMKLLLDSITLSRSGKTYDYHTGVGAMGNNQFKSEEWTTEEWDYWYGYYETVSWRKDYFVHLEGRAYGTIEYSGAIASLIPDQITWHDSPTETAIVHTKPNLLGGASIKVSVVDYQLRIKVSTVTYKDGSKYDEDDGDWTSWKSFTTSSTNYVELNMSNMGVSLFVVVTVAIVSVILVVLIFTKRRVEIVSPEDEETGRIVLPAEEVGPPPSPPPKEEVGQPPPKEIVETTGNRCPFCGSVNSPTAQYCVDCGSMLEE